MQTEVMVRLLRLLRLLCHIPKEASVLGLQVIDEGFLPVDEGLHLLHAHLNVLGRFSGYEAVESIKFIR